MRSFIIYIFLALTLTSFGQFEGEQQIRIDTVKMQRAQDSIDSFYKEKFHKELKKINKYYSKSRYENAKLILYEIIKDSPDCNYCKNLVMECDQAYADQKMYELNIKHADALLFEGKFESAKKLYLKYPNDRYCAKQLRRIDKKMSKIKIEAD